jgi:hypothetical protein
LFAKLSNVSQLYQIYNSIFPMLTEQCRREWNAYNSS